MNDLIEALQIFAKYMDKDEEYPTFCAKELLAIRRVGEHDVSEQEEARLIELGFYWDDDCNSWVSDRFGG